MKEPKLKFDTQEKAAIALNKINLLCGYPCEVRATETWDIAEGAVEGFFYISKPPDEFMIGVVDFEIMEFNPTWLPPQEEEII